MKIMLAGDTHGDFANVKHKIDKAKELGDIQRVIVLGDFGLWWGFPGVEYLDQINEYAKANNIQVFAIPGNHECHELWTHLVEGAREAQATSKGWAYVRSHVLLSPKVHDFVWGNKQFVVAGGAVSIDKKWRLEYEAHKHKKIWSPGEQLLDSEMEPLLQSRFANGVEVDFLLTHDCSNMTPWKGRLKPDIDSQIHRQRIDTILRAVRPKNHFHGHMHERYDWMNLTGDDHWTQTYGLECNNDIWSWGILDLKTSEFKWGHLALAEKLDADPKREVEISDDF